MKEWWKEAVVYQIYPKSFQDSNGDGIGDLTGIIERIPYLKALGVNVIWLCPVYPSPMRDGGYDISDYYEIDPMFGTMADMERLIAVAKAAGIQILMDLVVNHTSDCHRWFQEALRNPNSKYRNYYIFRKGAGDGPPNNWRCYFGGSAWEPVAGEENTYFLHAFAKEQPDLNWENEQVRQEIIDMINWWLEKGLGGFRIDAILNLKKKVPMGMLPADGEDGLAFIGKWILNQAGIETWLKELDDATFRAHNSLTVAEADVPEYQLKQYIGDQGFFRMVFDFSYTDIDVPETGEWYQHTGFTIKQLRDAIFYSELMTQKAGWGARYLENHDQPRSVNKYLPPGDIHDKSKKMLAVLFMMLRGTPFIYQGQEIGMENIQMEHLSDYDDVASHDQYERAIQSGLSEKDAFEMLYRRSRDNSRTPMQWNENTHAGFTTAEKTWLKMHPNYPQINVQKETADPESVLHFYKKLIYLRRKSTYRDIIVYGTFVPMDMGNNNIIAYKRVLDSRVLLVLINMSPESNQINLEQEYVRVVLHNAKESIEISKCLTLEPYAAIILAGAD